jgi:hypothetical protein
MDSPPLRCKVFLQSSISFGIQGSETNKGVYRTLGMSEQQTQRASKHACKAQVWQLLAATSRQLHRGNPRLYADRITLLPLMAAHRCRLMIPKSKLLLVKGLKSCAL